MIKIVTGSTVPMGSTVALVSLCNHFNSRGISCTLYGPDKWHLDKCKSGNIGDFRPETGDIIVVHDLRLLSTSDLHDLNALIGESRKDFLLRNIKNFFTGRSTGSQPNQYKLVLTCRGEGQSRTSLPRLTMFNKIHCTNDTCQICRKTKHLSFICPNFLDDLKKSENKPDKIAGVIGTIRKENQLEQSIERALRDGMKSVIIFGYLADPSYYYSTIEPLTKTYPGKIKFAGFIDVKQKVYDSVSDVYCSVSKPWSLIEHECTLTGTSFHGPNTATSTETMTNDQIFRVWKEELTL